MKFGSTAPSWLVTGVFSESRVTDTINNIPNDITVQPGALLNLRDDFICNGKLIQDAATIRVKAGKLVKIESLE